MHGAKLKPLVYVVDDEPIIATTLALIIEAQGFSAKSFNFPLDALEAARTEAPDLLLSDVIMPQMNGVELALGLHALSPQCKFILLSGQAASHDLLERAREAGTTFEIIGKPVHPLKVIEAVHRLLD